MRCPMLHWAWPQTWSFENRESVRVAVEKAIRSAMADGQNSRIRGTVIVDLPHMGSTPPQLMLSSIRELSMEHVALMVKLRYEGDFSITLRGLQINLDTIGSNAPDEADANLAMPFFCPFEMTLKDVVIDGVASVEVLREYSATPSNQSSPFGGGASVSFTAPRPQNEGGADRTPMVPLHLFSPPSGTLTAASSEAAAALPPGRSPGRRSMVNVGSATPSSGYGVLLGAGGRRAMRLPDPSHRNAGPFISSSSSAASSFMPLTKESITTPSISRGAAAAGPTAGSSRGCSIADLLLHRVRPTSTTVKVQLFGDPIKAFSVISNFESVPGASSKVEGTVRMLLKPAIERLMTDGITLTF